jgi:hypothetical protein
LPLSALTPSAIQRSWLSALTCAWAAEALII